MAFSSTQQAAAFFNDMHHKLFVEGQANLVSDYFDNNAIVYTNWDQPMNITKLMNRVKIIHSKIDKISYTTENILSNDNFLAYNGVITVTKDAQITKIKTMQFAALDPKTNKILQFWELAIPDNEALNNVKGVVNTNQD